MTEQDAMMLYHHIRQHYPAITAEYVKPPARLGYGYQVRLTLCHRILVVSDIEEWESILQAWQYFLPARKGK